MFWIIKYIIAIFLAVYVFCFFNSYSIARFAPSYVAFFSFDDGIFSFSRHFTTGKVGPFDIGQGFIPKYLDLNKFSGPYKENFGKQFYIYRGNRNVFRPVYAIYVKDNRISSIKLISRIGYL